MQLKEYSRNKRASIVYQHADGTPLAKLPVPAKADTGYSSTRYINVKIGSNNKAQMLVSGIPADTDKELPELYKIRKECCGCTACVVSCNSGAILMLPDEEGFLYPVIDAMKCVRCYRCMKVCLFKKRMGKTKIERII